MYGYALALSASEQIIALDHSPVLWDDGDPVSLGPIVRELNDLLPSVFEIPSFPRVPSIGRIWTLCALGGTDPSMYMIYLKCVRKIDRRTPSLCSPWVTVDP